MAGVVVSGREKIFQ